MPRYARISINIPQLTGLFDYSIPPDFQDEIQPGSLVDVPFGAQEAQGIVIQLLDEPSVAETKSIHAVLEKEPVVTPYQMELARWMAEENLATLSQCLDMMLPAGLSQHTDVVLHLLESNPSQNLTAAQQQVIKVLEKRGDLHGRQLDHALPRVNWRESIPGLVKRGVLQSRAVLSPPGVRPKITRTALFSAPADWREAEGITFGTREPAIGRRRAVVEFLEAQAIPVNVTWIFTETGATSADLTFLAEKGLITLGETEVWRDPLDKLEPVLTTPPVLTDDQQKVWKQIEEEISEPSMQKPGLLVGVTGSGKTEIYLQATAEVLKSGKGVIILVPEISLTPQTIKRFFGRFPGKVGLIHSQLSAGERYDTWRRIRAGQLPIVVGARSALFSPLPEIGLIVIDECHDSSYHQEDFAPHYHTLPAAVALSQITGSQLLLGSATPELETLYLFERQDWNIFRLPKRILAHQEISVNVDTPPIPRYSTLPRVEVVDMRKELAAGNRSPLSRSLLMEIKSVLEREEQAILFLNRRGSASYVFCRDCGYVLRCPRCDTQLTYHADESSLICHTCNYQRNMPQKCPNCGSTKIRQFGLGTESLERMVINLFPDARMLRWDADTARYKGAHDIILDHFIHHRADILIGTQMIAKGHDLPLVTLVGAVLADTSLNLPDFRASERTYQLLTQVAGRAGRSGRGGRVIFQTFQPENYAIKAAAAYDAEGFYQTELSFRERTGYPPFSRLLRIEFDHADAGKTQEAAQSAGEHLRYWIETEGMAGTSIIGPVPCFYQRRAGYYRWQILVRGPDPRRLLTRHPLKTWAPPGMTVDITIDPTRVL
jgi:primosomal protein N' (replication factor Y)